MRATLTLEDEAYDAAEGYASARGIKVSAAVSELILLASRPRVSVIEKNGLKVFDLPMSTPTISAARTRALILDSE